MMRYAIWTDRAQDDLEAARVWYEDQLSGLGEELMEAVLAAVDIARERPRSIPEIRRGVRGIRCNRFPYRIYIEVEDERIVVLAVYHTARDPDRWDDPERE